MCDALPTASLIFASSQGEHTKPPECAGHSFSYGRPTFHLNNMGKTTDWEDKLFGAKLEGYIVYMSRTNALCCFVQCSKGELQCYRIQGENIRRCGYIRKA